MLLPVLAIASGFALLVWGADRFVAGASSTASNLGVPPLIIGLTIVGLGTSAPEILVAGMASLQGNPGLAIGNAVGSNIANIGLIIGTAALVRPLMVHSRTLRREYPVLLFVTLLALVLILDGHLGVLDGVILLGSLLGILYWMIRIALDSRAGDPIATEFEAEIDEGMPLARALLWLAIGLAALLISSRILVWGAVSVAQHFGVSDLVIGLTIVAIGTSLPELAASIMSVLRNEDDIAIGNVIGSNMYNLLAVFSLPGILAPGATDALVLSRDFPVMIGLTLALFAMSYGIRGRGRVNRLEGTALLAVFCGYQYYLFLTI